jgi:hypothetical protein
MIITNVNLDDMTYLEVSNESYQVLEYYSDLPLEDVIILIERLKTNHPENSKFTLKLEKYEDENPTLVLDVKTEITKPLTKEILLNLPEVRMACIDYISSNREKIEVYSKNMNTLLQQKADIATALNVVDLPEIAITAMKAKLVSLDGDLGSIQSRIDLAKEELRKWEARLEKRRKILDIIKTM